MAKTTINCQICLEEIREGNLSNDPTLSTFPIKTNSPADENSLTCHECKIKTDEEHPPFMNNENIIKTENVPQLFPTNFSTVVSGENLLKTIKHEFDEVAVKFENVVKEECVLFNMDMPTCVEESASYYCHQCNYATSNKQTLIDHVLIHLFTCNLCSYTTFNNSSLEEHKDVHLMFYMTRVASKLLRLGIIKYTLKKKRLNVIFVIIAAVHPAT
ncbi:hypothetical protein FQR65_LT16814 [Abscondita terminalis]|nr:hypothetical protein FQR65_LT16814 [Abscondita terminalis]